MEFGTRAGQNGGVFVSVETLTTIIGVVGVLASFASAFVWLIRRMDARFDRFDAKLDARIDGVEARLDSRIDGVEARLDARIDGVEARLTERIDGVEARLTERLGGVETRLGHVEQGLVEVKIAVARLEGPPPRLVPVR